MDYEKKYKEALERMKSWARGEHPECFTEAQAAAEFIFPELIESEDEKIRKSLINYFSDFHLQTFVGLSPKKILAWLEKQGEHLENYDEAEKEKADFVGDGFIECHADFLDFKEGNTYWLEYIGDDKYNVRSDNLLGKTYHITPCQLYTVFKKLTWLEKQGEQKSTDVEEVNFFDDFRKTDSEVEPMFYVGEWITNGDYTWKIVEVKPLDYILQSQDGNIVVDTISHVDEQFHSFTVQDANDGDVLQLGKITAIFKELISNEHCKCCCSVYNGEFEIRVDNIYGCYNATPATKEQRDLLFQKMNEAGYEWDTEKKELKKIPNAFEKCEIVHIEHGKYYYCIKDYYAGGNKRASEGDVVQALNGMSMMALGVKANEYFVPVNTIKQMYAWSEEDEKMFIKLHNLIYVVRDHDCDSTRKKELSYWLESLKNRVQPKQEWSALDERNLQGIIDEIEANKNQAPDYDIKTYDRFLTWLKSLRPQKQWKPSEEQLKSLQEVIDEGHFTSYPNAIETLYEQLKQL